MQDGAANGHGEKHSNCTILQDGAANGHGALRTRDGDTYDGAWRDDCRHGFGTLVDGADGDTYEGRWQVQFECVIVQLEEIRTRAAGRCRRRGVHCTTH